MNHYPRYTVMDSGFTVASERNVARLSYKLRRFSKTGLMDP